MNELAIAPENREKTLWTLSGLEQGRAIFLKGISDQVERARQPRETFASAHEAYGMLADKVSAVWDVTRQKPGRRDTHQLRQGLIEVAAIALKALESLDVFDPNGD
jgi:hypothetical protein